MPTIYSYHPQTREFVGALIADESPREPGVFLIPACATSVKPPIVPEGHRAVFDGSAWLLETVPYLPQEPTDETGDNPVAIVVVVTPWQIRKALNQIGLRNAVEAAVATSDQETKDGWEFADEFRRDNVLISAVAAALGKTDADIDALFALAMTL